LVLAQDNQRSPAQQISFLVELAQNAKTDVELRLAYGKGKKS
jgi:hypothetical protein